MFRKSMLAAVTLILVVFWILFSFVLRTGSTSPSFAPPPVGVVFTGSFDRVEEGLRMLDHDDLSLLYISGVNQGAGITTANFARLFALSDKLLGDLKSGRIILATKADDTIENAIETSCWLAQNPDIRSVVLITSSLHMPRASVALERTTPVRIERLPVGALKPGAWVFRTVEFRKYVATWFATLLPQSLWPARNGLACNQD